MLGIPDFKRKDLGNFQVVEDPNIFYYRLFHQGIVVFEGQRAYPTEALAEQALTEIFGLSSTCGQL